MVNERSAKPIHGRQLPLDHSLSQERKEAMASSDNSLYASKLGQGTLNVPGVTELGKSKKQAVEGEVTRYIENYTGSRSEAGKQTEREIALKNRREHAKDTTTNFYSLVTDFYEYGYGHSFHFAPIYDGKSLSENITIYEQGVAKILKAKPGMKILVSSLKIYITFWNCLLFLVYSLTGSFPQHLVCMYKLGKIKTSIQ